MKIKTQQIKKKVLKSLKEKKAKQEKENDDDDRPVYASEPANNESEDDDDVSMNSDEELQLAFARQQLKPGLNVAVDQPKQFANDQEGLKRKLKDFYLKLDWAERLDVTVPKPKLDGFDGLSDERKSIEMAENDFKRESLFMMQARAAIALALPRLNKLGIPTKRPDDYFAQMAKSDDHMKRVREKLMSKHAEIEKRDKVRKLRELKKMGKKIQIEAEKKKQESKRKLKESIKKFKKGDKDDLKIELEDDFSGNKRSKMLANKRDRDDTDNDGSNRKFKRQNTNGIKKPGKKTLYKEQKYGFGGRKKRSKYNTAESSSDLYDTKPKRSSGFGSTTRNGRTNFGKGKKDFGAKKFQNKNKNPKNKKKR